MSHVEFEVSASEDVISRWKEQGALADVLVVVPLRKGCETYLRDDASDEARVVVYVSCNPNIIENDLRVLENSRYRMRRL